MAIFAATYAAHPVIPPVAQASLDDVPEIIVEEPPVPRLVVPHGAPMRPRTAPAPTPEPTATEKSADPMIAPEMSDEQLTAAKSAVQQSLGIAERNLNLTQGKALNATQQDLVSKIRGLMDSTREAVKNNDWPRARTQARKAEVLSQEIFPNQ